MSAAFVSASWWCSPGTGRTCGARSSLCSGLGLLALAVLFAALLSRHVRGLGRAAFRIRALPVWLRCTSLSDALTAYRFKFPHLVLAFCVSLLTLVRVQFVPSTLSSWPWAAAFPSDVFLFNPLIAFVLLLPISLGGLGLSQGAFVFFYGLVGVPIQVSFPVSLVMQIIIYITSLPGGVLWWRSRRRLRLTEPRCLISAAAPRHLTGRGARKVWLG